MRKLIQALLISLALLGLTNSTIIITHSVPKVFQLTNSKMAIVIDEDDSVARDHIRKIQDQDAPLEEASVQVQSRDPYFKPTE